MPLTLVTGPANSAKARVVLDGVRGALDREPLLVVPTGEDVASYRRELADDGIVMGPKVLTFAALIGEIARRAGVETRPVGALARERVVGAVLARAELDVLAPSAATPGFAHAAAGLFGELEVARVEPGRLAGGLRQWAGADRGRAAYGSELARLYGGYRATLDRLGRPDRELWSIGALDALRSAPGAWGATPVFFYGFDDLTPLQRDAVEALALSVGAEVWVSLTYEPGRIAFAARATTFESLKPLAASVVALDARDDHYAEGSRAALHALERRLFEDDDAAPVDPGDAVALLEAGGERAEAELVGAEVLRLIADGVPPHRIAVVTRSLDDAAPVLERVLADMGLALSLRRRVAFGRTAVGRALLALLRCAAGDGTAADLVIALRAPGMLDDDPELPDVEEAVDALERTVRRRGIATVAAALRVWPADEPPAFGRVREAAAEGAAPLCTALTVELRRLGAAVAAASGPVPEPGAAAEIRAADAGRRALGELGALAEEAPPLAPGPAELAAQLAAVDVRVGEAPAPGRVTVCEPLALRARRVRALVLCGLQEGVFPRPGRPEPFLSDDERRELALASGIVLPRHEDALGAERYLFYATVSRPEERLVLACRTADDDGDPAVRSFLVDDVADVLAPLPVVRRTLGAVGWDGGAPTARLAARAAADAAPARRPAPIAPLRSEAVLRALREQPAWSPSALEAWASCPVKWFVDRYLKAADLEPDSEYLVRGTLAHEALEHTLGALRAETGSAKVRPETLERARELLQGTLAEIAARTPLSPSPERLAAGTRRLEADLVRYLEAAARDGSGFEPEHLEARFGFDDEAPSLPPLELQAPDGPIRLRGRIDRIDVEPGTRRAQVVDYKTGKAVEGARWERDRSFQAALYLRAATDLLGLEPAGAFYQPVTAPDLRRRGLLDEEADPDLDAVATDRKPADEVGETMHRVIDLALAAAAEARAGALEPRPDTCTTRGCAYPGICRCEAPGP